MTPFLSPEWLQHMADAAASSESLRAAAADMRLTVGHCITGGPQGDVTYRVRFGDGRVDVEAGAGEADVEVRQGYATAVAINRGELAAAEAFAAGLVQLGGRPGVLAQHKEALARLEDVFAPLRARTTY